MIIGNMMHALYWTIPGKVGCMSHANDSLIVKFTNKALATKGIYQNNNFYKNYPIQ